MERLDRAALELFCFVIFAENVVIRNRRHKIFQNVVRSASSQLLYGFSHGVGYSSVKQRTPTNS